MPRNITITFDDNTTHVYQGAPDDITPAQIEERAAKEFAGKKVKAMDGGRGGAAGGNSPVLPGSNAGQKPPTAPSGSPGASLSASPPVAAPAPAAAEGQPAAQLTPRTPTSRAADIGIAATVGGVLGAAAPEIVSGVGMGMALTPAAPFAPAVIAAGRAMRAGRVALALNGALSGAVSEGTEQAASGLGATPGEAKAAGFAAGLLTPGVAAVKGFVTGAGRTAWTALQRIAGGAEASTPAAVRTAQKVLSAPAVAAQPQLTMHKILADGIAQDRQAADAAAKDLLARAHTRAASLAKQDSAAAATAVHEAEQEGKRLVALAAARADTVRKAAGVDLAKASRVHALADRELTAAIGQPQELSDIGNTLRAGVTTAHRTAIGERTAQYTAKVAERDAAVAAREASGIHLDSMEGMKTLKDDISRKLLITKKGREAAGGKAEVTEQGMLTAYQKVWDSINNRRVQVGTSADGNPTYQTFKTTFEALDHVRRRLGDVAYGKEAEGYAALGQATAKTLYGRIAKVQEEYAGPVQAELQAGYHEATAGMAKFKAGTGQRLTAVDRVDPETFLHDPATLPGKYFHSQQGVRDLAELTGKPEAVAGAARAYVARQLEGKSSAQAKAWLDAPAQRDWMREVPGLQAAAGKYTGKLSQIERVEGGLQKRGQSRLAEARKAQAAIPEVAAAADAATTARQLKAEGLAAAGRKQQAAVVEGAEAEAKATRAAVESRAAAVVKDGFPAEGVRKLLLGGSPEDLRTATRYLAGAPGGKAALEGSVRNVLAEVAPAKLDAVWRDRMAPMLREGQLVPAAAMRKLEADVARVLRAHSGAPAVTMVQRLVVAAMAGAAGQGAAAVKRKAGGEASGDWAEDVPQ
jgi:hypothetical protein